MQKRKTIPFLLALVVSLSFLFSFPLTASAAASSFSKFHANVFWVDGSGNVDYVEEVNQSIPFSKTYSGKVQQNLESVEISFNNKLSWEENAYFKLNMKLDTDGTRYSGMNVLITFTSSSGGSFTRTGKYSNGVVTCESTFYNTGADYTVTVKLTNFVYSSSQTTNTYLKIESVSYSIESEKTGFYNKVFSFFSDLLSRLANWFTELINSIKNGFNNLTSSISSFFDNLISEIQKKFNELALGLAQFFKDLKGWFDSLINKLQSWFDNVGYWFVTIGDRIGEFFNKLWNRIWWGNENGESEYKKPVINNKLIDILKTLQEYQAQLQATIDTIGSAGAEVSAYISTGTQLVDGVVGVAGAGFSALIVFGIVFVLVRKVVGR